MCIVERRIKIKIKISNLKLEGMSEQNTLLGGGKRMMMSMHWAALSQKSLLTAL